MGNWIRKFRDISLVLLFAGLNLCVWNSATAATATKSVPGVGALSEQWTSVRALGMGNAYSAVVDDADSLFYNPAGLARVSGFDWVVMDPRGGLDRPQILNEAAKLVESGSNTANQLNQMYGNYYWLGAGAKSAITIPYLGVAAFSSGDMQLNLTNSAYPQMNLNYFFDYGFAVGVGMELVPTLVKFGLSGKRINRTGTSTPLGPASLATLNTTTIKDQLQSRGTAYSLDAGMIFTIPSPIKPVLSVVWKDIGVTQFKHESGPGAPPRILDELIVGAAIDMKVPFFSLTPSIDVKHVLQQDVQLGKKLHLGLEFGIPLLDFRVGLNQGYYTAGVGLDLGLMRVDAATYGVELGVYPGQLEDRRYVVQMTIDLGFDPGKWGLGGGGSGGGGADGKGGGSERRRLKQRR